MHLFKKRFMELTFPEVSEMNMNNLAHERASRRGTEFEEEEVSILKEFKGAGNVMYSFDSATTAALKQQRHKLILAACGSLNLQIDEIGSNFVSNQEVLDAYLELFDVGLIKNKLIKNTQENIRNEEVFGRTPTNLLLFGTPSKLLDGGKVEEDFNTSLETGYARRCFIGYVREHERSHIGDDICIKQYAEKLYNKLTDTTNNQFIDDFSARVEALADPVNIGKSLTMSRDVALAIIQYRLSCEIRAEEFARHDEIRRAEMCHRYFKVTKLAGAYAFIEGSDEITQEHLEQAIKLAEDSGVAFDKLLKRERAHERLAMYITEAKMELNHADLVKDLPFFRGSASVKNDMIKLAIAWGYRNNRIIKRFQTDGIEFFSGESLQPTTDDNLIFSISDDITYHYEGFNSLSYEDILNAVTLMAFPQPIEFDEDGNEIPPVPQVQKGLHWLNHNLKTNETTRREDNIESGFNIIVLDIDGGVTIDFVKAFLGDYKYIIYTTKSHDPDNGKHHFRLILFSNYILKLDRDDYKEFMQNLSQWLPFDLDTSTFHRSRKWATHNGELYSKEDGKYLDVLPFIPKTSKNDERIAHMTSQEDLDNIERWVINNTSEGNRNNMLHRYAMILLDAGEDQSLIQNKIIALNEKLPNSLDTAELHSTVFTTLSNEISKRNS